MLETSPLVLLRIAFASVATSLRSIAAASAEGRKEQTARAAAAIEAILKNFMMSDSLEVRAFGLRFGLRSAGEERIRKREAFHLKRGFYTPSSLLECVG